MKHLTLLFTFFLFSLTGATAQTIKATVDAEVYPLVGTTDDTAPTAEPNHPVADTTTKFANLQFGKNYEVSQR